MQGKNRYIKASARGTRRNRVRDIFYLFFKLVIPIILVIGIVFILRADFLQVKNVEVVGNVSIQKEEVESLILQEISGQYFFVIPKANYFFVKKEKLVQKILGDFSRADSVEVNKNFNGTLEIRLVERQGDFVWCSNLPTDTCYSMTQNGLAFVEIGQEETRDKIIFRNNLVEVGLLKNFGMKEDMQNYLKAISIFKEAQFEVNEIRLILSDKIVFITDIGEIFLNPEEDLFLTAPNAVILINDVKTKNPSAVFEYIDARFGNKVFYKLR